MGNEQIKMNKKLTWFLSLLGVVVLLYLVMFLNTNFIVDYAKNIMLGNVEKSVTMETPLDAYNNSDILENAKVKASITRLFVWHNFFDGYVWVIYSYETIENDRDVKPGSWNVVSKWKIHRENGEWQVVGIEEAP